MRKYDPIKTALIEFNDCNRPEAFTIIFGTLGFISEGSSWSKWLYLFGGLFAFAGHIIWLSKSR